MGIDIGHRPGDVGTQAYRVDLTQDVERGHVVILNGVEIDLSKLHFDLRILL
jgi:hypothetical protein